MVRRYERCDPNNPNWWHDDDYHYLDGVAEEEGGAFPISAPAAPMADQETQATATTGTADGDSASKAKEDSYETNTQVSLLYLTL